MSDPEENGGENFIARWSRRKLGEPAAPAPEQPVTASIDEGALRQSADASRPTDASADACDFDVANLPPIETIDANTDIRPFLAKGVPSDLARAALRRAWSSDPAIREFVGLSENSWDFNAPDGIPGFGPIDPAAVARFLAQIAESSGPAAASEGERAPVATAATNQAIQDAGEFVRPAGEGGGRVEVEPPLQPEPPPQSISSTAAAITLGERADSAVQDGSKPDQPAAQLQPHRHGGALPE